MAFPRVFLMAIALLPFNFSADIFAIYNLGIPKRTNISNSTRTPPQTRVEDLDFCLHVAKPIFDFALRCSTSALRFSRLSDLKERRILESPTSVRSKSPAEKVKQQSKAPRETSFSDRNPKDARALTISRFRGHTGPICYAIPSDMWDDLLRAQRPLEDDSDLFDRQTGKLTSLRVHVLHVLSTGLWWFQFLYAIGAMVSKKRTARFQLIACINCLQNLILTGVRQQIKGHSRTAGKHCPFATQIQNYGEDKVNIYSRRVNKPTHGSQKKCFQLPHPQQYLHHLTCFCCMLFPTFRRQNFDIFTAMRGRTSVGPINTIACWVGTVFPTTEERNERKIIYSCAPTAREQLGPGPPSKSYLVSRFPRGLVPTGREELTTRREAMAPR